MTILRRALMTLLAAVAIVAAVPVAALASAQEVIEDYRDDGQIQGCYSARDFNRAVEELDPQAGIYEQARDIIRAAQVRCAAEGGGGDEGGSGAGVWIGIVVAVGLVAIGAGTLARRRGREDGGGGTGSDGA